jgi:GNAT superfamily N-acetyltransferase
VIRLSRRSDRGAILRFIEQIGFNPRDAATWDGLGMVAMTAWSGAQLVGAIPLEPRLWQLWPGCVVSAVHQTSVGVLPEFRGRGIGSLMQEALDAHQPALASIATVFREDETSRAYQWYRRNGFVPALRASAWVADVPSDADVSVPVDVLDPGDPGIDWTSIDKLWREQQVDHCGGFVCRTRRPLRDWLSVHPYRNRYHFKILPLHDGGDLVAYAVLGVGQLHSRTTRVEIMEQATRAGSPRLVEELCRATTAFAARHGYRPVRWAMAAGDPGVNVARRQGFEQNWEFDLLWRPLASLDVTLPSVAERRRLWRYHSLDYA